MFELMITSTQNPKIKQVLKLRKAGERRQTGFILIEGYHEIQMAALGGIAMESLYYCPAFASDKLSPDTIPCRETILVSDKAFAKIAYREHPDGFLAIARPIALDLAKLCLSKNPLLIILEQVEKPGNLGAILRTADAAGIDAVIVCDSQTDIYNPNVIRASLGAVFTVPLAAAAASEVLPWLKRQKINIYAAVPKAGTTYTKSDFTVPSAIVIGAEHAGLSDFWRKKADERILIPMKGRIDSLNASVSAAIILFEALRQRK